MHARVRVAVVGLCVCVCPVEIRFCVCLHLLRIVPTVHKIMKAPYVQNARPRVDNVTA